MNNSGGYRVFSRILTSVCASCRSDLVSRSTKPFLQPISTPALRTFSTTSQLCASDKKPSAPRATDYGNMLGHADRISSDSGVSDLIKSTTQPFKDDFDVRGWNEQFKTPTPYHFHIMSTKHNTHITVTKPDRGALKGLSVSAGNIGFRKAARGSYDAAYQLAAYVLNKIHHDGLLGKIRENKLEVIFRGFGAGREAVGKALTGSEGARVRPYIKRVTDATRLKFGGTRSPKPRRLG